MWTGLLILFVMIALWAYLKTRPVEVPVLTDTPIVPSPWSEPVICNDPMCTTASWAGGRRPIRRPSTQAPQISMPLIRWAERTIALGNRTGPTSASYWQAVDILKNAERGEWFIVPDETGAGADMYQRYQRPADLVLPAVRPAIPVPRPGPGAPVPAGATNVRPADIIAEAHGGGHHQPRTVTPATLLKSEL